MPLLYEQQHECAACRSAQPAPCCNGTAVAPPSYGIALVDGPRTPVQAQMQFGGRKRSDAEIHTAAQHGVNSTSIPLPYLERIQESFGPHFDVSAIQAHVGPAATQANRRMSTQGFAMGEHVAFREQPDLQLAAHEAAHVVQQRSGVQLSGGVGMEGDAYERHAEEVAQRVVEGASAEHLLEATPGPSHTPSFGTHAVQRTVQHKAEKQVSNNALVRLQMAKGAMEMTKSVLKHGAGNQVKALEASKLNSFYRMKLARNPNLWTVDPSVNDLLTRDPGAYDAARAYVAQGGNCGEHGRIAYEFLKTLAKGQRITLAAKQGLDHAFVLIGDLAETDGKKNEADSEIAVADPWPTSPGPTLWEDHFAYTSKRSEIEKSASTVASGTSSMLAIAAGIKPNEKGQELINKTADEGEVKAKIARHEQDHLWDQSSAADDGKDYTYFTKDAMDRRVDLK